MGACFHPHLTGHLGFDFMEDMVGRDSFGFGFEVGDKTVPESRQDGLLNVIKTDIESTLSQGPCFSRKN